MAITKEELMDLINRSLFATVGYNDEQGRPNVRRVFCTWHKGLGSHLISTNTSSAHVKSFLNDDRTCLYFSDDIKFEGLCLYGKVVVHFEREYKALLWHDGDEQYYPKGIEDEDYCIVEFIADEGRYYRFDGKGDLTKEEIQAFDEGREYEDGYEKSAE